MEDINKKANEDELNKAHEEIGKTPRKFIPVPKSKNQTKMENTTAVCDKQSYSFMIEKLSPTDYLDKAYGYVGTLSKTINGKWTMSNHHSVRAIAFTLLDNGSVLYKEVKGYSHNCGEVLPHLTHHSGTYTLDELQMMDVESYLVGFREIPMEVFEEIYEQSREYRKFLVDTCAKIRKKILKSSKKLDM